MAARYSSNHDPRRFEVSRLTLAVDAFMTQFIKIGGIGIILAVCAIFVFILMQVLPLFSGATVRPAGLVDTGLSSVAVFGADEWSELPFAVSPEGDFSFIDLAYDQKRRASLGPRGVFSVSSGLPEGARVTAIQYHRSENQVAFGFADGRFAITDVKYRSVFSPSQERQIEAEVSTGTVFSFGDADSPVLAVDYFTSERRGALVAGILGDADGDSAAREVRVAAFTRARTLFGVGNWRASFNRDLTPEIEGVPTQVLVNGLGTAVLVLTEPGEVFYFLVSGNTLTLQQRFFPVAEYLAQQNGAEPEKFLGQAKILTANWLLGNESLVLTSTLGDTIVAQPMPTGGQGGIRYTTAAKRFKPIAGGDADLFAKSLRNRAFAVAVGRQVTLRYATTESTRWEGQLEVEPVALLIGSRYDRLMALDAVGRLEILTLSDPHPESSFKAFFGKVWYEGQPEPAYVYQASAASESAEVKYSMVNLLWGSLKGTFFALIFAVPIALLAAIYTSQFLRPEFKKVIKPTMEVMASLPSVVLGFLGGLWLAPLIEARVPSVLLIASLVPLVAWGFGWWWSRLPQRIRLRVRPGWEFLVMIPLLLLTAWVAWQLGPLVEQVLFVTTNAATGERVADFRLWWPQATGMAYLPRNAMVVGFMMGFAVIPIIFTITEDSLSNVPKFLNSASLALGASRWQTAWHIVVPTASAGIFSALMIGFGRAVGETMIVVMCSGNTPVFEFPAVNPFDGMRALSANIAVELPEAPKDSTHFRVLYLGALLLFLLTFVVNTAAEVLRSRLREKYKTVG